MTLTYFMARSTWVAHAFEWKKKMLKCHSKGKASKKLANGQNIDYSEKQKRRKWPKGFICPCTGVKYHNIQIWLLVYAADSGERLQNYWSSGLKTPLTWHKIHLGCKFAHSHPGCKLHPGANVAHELLKTCLVYIFLRCGNWYQCFYTFEF